MINRRTFITSMGVTLLCAPAIVRASSLMAVKPFDISDIPEVEPVFRWMDTETAYVQFPWKGWSYSACVPLYDGTPMPTSQAHIQAAIDYWKANPAAGRIL